MKKYILIFSLSIAFSLSAQDFEKQPRDGYAHQFKDQAPEIVASIGGTLELGAGWSLMMGEISSDGYRETTFLCDFSLGGSLVHDFENAYGMLHSRIGIQPRIPVYFGTRYKWLMGEGKRAGHYLTPMIGYSSFTPYRDTFKRWGMYVGYDVNLQDLTDQALTNLHFVVTVTF